MAAYNQSKAMRSTAQNNAQISEWQAQDAQRRGELDAQAVRRQALGMQSTQRAAYAGRGLDIGSGTPGDIIDQTGFFGEIDAATARDNAAKEAWARRANASNFQVEAASQRPWLAGGTTLLAGAGRVADRWYSNRNPDLR